MPSPRVSVIVPARDAAATLPALLAALAAQQDAPPYELIVADDGSRDATAALAQAAGARVVRTGGRGPGAARNAARAVASAAVLAFTDADCVPAPGWLAAGVRAVDAGHDLVQGRVVPAGLAGHWDRTVRVAGLTHLYETANLFIRAARFDDLGGFERWIDPLRSKELAEDVWLGWRARRAGADIAFAADAVVAHAVFPRGPGGYVAERARLRFFPELAARIPELRDAVFYRRAFLSRRTAAYDLAAAAVVAAAVTRRPALLLGGVPYARQVLAVAGPAGRRRGPLVAAVEVAADSVGAAALLAGSVRARSALL